jgi:hypothetical protein
MDLEQSRLALPTGTTERVNRWAYIDVDETAFFKHPPPACARQATGNSIGPKVDVADLCFRHGLTGRDIGELQASARLQHPHDLTEDAALVGAKVDDAVADDDIGPGGLDEQILDHALPEPDIADTHRRCRRTGALQHFSGHVDADNLPLGPDLFGGDKAVEAAARPEIDNPLAGPQYALREWIPDPCKCFNGQAFGPQQFRRSPGVAPVGVLYGNDNFRADQQPRSDI